MTEHSRDYVEGYEKCMSDIDQYIYESILKHGGCTTGVQAFHVVNDIATFTHTQSLRIKRLKEEISAKNFTFMMI